MVLSRLDRASGIWMYSVLLKLQSSGSWPKIPISLCLKKKNPGAKRCSILL